MRNELELWQAKTYHGYTICISHRLVPWSRVMRADCSLYVTYIALILVVKKREERIVGCQLFSVSDLGRPSSHDGAGATALVVGFEILTDVAMLAAAQRAVSLCIAILFSYTR